MNDAKKSRLILGQARRNFRVFTLDAIIAYFSFVAAFYIRADFRSISILQFQNITSPFFYVILTGFIGYVIGIYRGRFNRGTLDEVLAINSQAFVTSLIILFFRVIYEVGNYPRSIPLIAALIYIVLILTTRIILRLYVPKKSRLSSRKQVLVYGAGTLGKQIANLLSLEGKAQLVGFIDDDPYKSNLVINGARVVSNLQKLDEYLTKKHIDQIIISSSAIDRFKINKIMEICGVHNVNLRAIDSASQLLLGIESLASLISLNESALLGRPRVSVDQDAISQLISGKVVLVTGAGGSIGSEIAKQCALHNPSKLYILDRDESALHNLELELFGTGSMNSDSMLLADIRDREAIKQLVESANPDIVFHAAALKHLPILENFPNEAFKTNVEGTKNVIDACINTKVRVFVNISTDKAADPTSVLGKTKYESEKLTVKASKFIEDDDSKYISVRFGNVIGSRGSVLHTFKFQIDHDLPITLTHPEVTRFFMTVSEAVALVLQSAVIGESGETLILDMGKPVKIADVANFLIKESGKDISIKHTGLREGEKLHEILASASENLVSRSHPKIFHTKVEIDD